jgi:DNA-binding transcriptional ArsR family regulator
LRAESELDWEQDFLMRMNEAFKALADPTRRQILKLLRRGEMTAGELAEHFDMTKPSMSHHFAVLKQADLVEARREGQQIYYSLNTTVTEDFLAIVWDLFSNRGPEGSKP